MSKHPEDLLDALSEILGLPREEVENMVDNMANEKLNDLGTIAPEHKSSSGKDKGKNAKYTATNYPHYLPAVNVQKYTIRIALRGISPSIWRKFEVPSNITLRHLSELCLELMGWENEHLNQFRKGDDYYAPFYQREYEMDPMFGPARNHNQEDYTIADLLKDKGKVICWEYDFGDSWEHDIRLSSVSEYAPDEPHTIVFKGGKRQCPPEDCGGVWGYEELLKLHAKLKSRKRLTEDELDRLDWYGMDNDYDPEDFDSEYCEEICDDFNE